ncbi:MAG: hypothetical protein NTW74_13265 [Acidobacteria bacterium]|nr:hypothetical protein [Acidobacteriota bacterium]
MPVTATNWLRPMRGGSQTHLLKASDGHHYVVKLTNNPQGIRTLINEWIAQRILSYLKIPCPEVEIIEIPQDLIEASPKLGILRNQIVQAPPAGWHFGSRYPGDPTVLTVYDILPDIQLVSCRNLHHFAAILAFDIWSANADSRQSVFYRARLLVVLASEDKIQDPDYAMRGLVASMIDLVRSWADFEPWLSRIQTFPESILDKALHEIPRAWLDSAHFDELTNLFDRLLQRRSKVPQLIEATKAKFPTHFPNWR